MPITPDIPAAEIAILEMTNAFRKQHNLAAVRPNPQLEAAARAYARVLAGGRDLSHTLQGTTPATRAQKAGYTYCQIAENLAVASDSRGFTARDYAIAPCAVGKLPSHRRNLLLPYLTDIASPSCVPPRRSAHIAVQLFGARDETRYEFKVRNTGTKSVAYEFCWASADHLEREQYMTHKSCMPRDINVFTNPKSKASARYETRDGRCTRWRPALTA